MLPRGGISGTRVLWACLAWAGTATIATIVVELRNGDATANLKTPGDAIFLMFALAPSVAGALTVSLTATRVAGWLLVAASTLGMTAFLLHAVVVALERTGSAPDVLLWPALWLGGPAFSLLALVPGRVRSGDRRPMLEPLALVAIAALVLAQAFGPDPLTGVGDDIAPIGNPLAVPALAGAANLIIDTVPLVILGYAAVSLVQLAWDGIRRRRLSDPDRAAWAVLGMLLPLTIIAGIAIGSATGQGPFAGAWVAAVVTPLVVLGAATILVVRAWATERRAAENLRREAGARESERTRVRRDLHDGIGPALAGMRLQLEALRDGIPAAATDVRAAADRLEASLDETLGELRRIVDGMEPSSLEEQGLRGALTGLTHSMTAGWVSAARVDLDVAPDLPSLPPEVESVLLRVCAEALSNAVRHADPTMCHVSLAWDGRAARLTVDDDGVGMSQLSVGVGLRSMRDRVEAVGGVLLISPRDRGRGTSVTATVPVGA